MSTLAESIGEIKKPWQWILGGGAILLIWGAMAIPNLHRELPAPHASQEMRAPERGYSAGPAPLAMATPPQSATDEMKTSPPPAAPDASTGRKIIRTSSLELVVQHPAETADRISALAQSLGGYLVSADAGGQNATGGMLTIRVPSARFEEARAAIRKLGLRVESEKIDAQDVTRQYVDQDATLRNLHAEEVQYLAIMRQANSVKDMLAVSEKLSEVRGQIERQQAEFNALSQQIDTVALTVSLRAEAEAQVFGLNWRPAYQLKMALRDGLDSLATYATAMTTIIFYLPALLLWVGTILAGTLISWRTIRWIGRRWFGWQITERVVQG